MAGIKKEINDIGNVTTFWPIRDQRSEEVELWKQEIELLFNQWELSIVVVLNPRGKPFSLSASVHWATPRIFTLLNVLVDIWISSFINIYTANYNFRYVIPFPPNSTMPLYGKNVTFRLSRKVILKWNSLAK